MLDLTKFSETVRCQIHKEQSLAFNLEDSPIPTLCNKCLLNNQTTENSNFITYQQLEQLLKKQQWKSDEEYLYLQELKTNVDKLIDVLMNTLRDFLKSFNESLQARCDMISDKMFIQRYLLQTSLDHFDLIRLRQQIRNIVRKNCNEYILQSPTDLSEVNQCIVSILNIIKESGEQLQKISNSSIVIQKNYDRIKQEQIIVKNEVNNQITKKLKIDIKKEQKIKKVHLKSAPQAQETNIYQGIDNDDHFKTSLQRYFHQSIKEVFTANKQTKLQEVVLDQSGSIMLTRDYEYSILTIWEYTTETSTFVSKQTICISSGIKISFGYLQKEQFLICKNTKTSLNILIYNLNEHSQFFENTHQIQLQKRAHSKFLIQPIQKYQLLIQNDGHIYIIELQDKKYESKLFAPHYCYSFYFDTLAEILYYSKKEQNKIFQSKLNQSQFQVVAVGPINTVYREIILIREQNMLVGYSFRGLLIINLEIAYRFRFISFESPIIQMPSIVQDLIIVQTEEGNMFMIQNDNLTKSRQFLDKVPSKTYFKFINELKRIYIFRNQNEISFISLDLHDFNQGKVIKLSSIQKGPK